MNATRKPPKVIDVVVGRPELLTWDAKARELQLEALPTLRASAERWAGSLTAILGAVSLAALLKGPEVFDGLVTGAADAGKVLFFGAAGLALLATALAAIAAQETSKKIAYPETGEALRMSVKAKVDTVRLELAASRWLAAAAVVAAFGSAAVLFWGETSESKPTEVSISNCEGLGAPITPEDDEASVQIRCQ